MTTRSITSLLYLSCVIPLIRPDLSSLIIAICLVFTDVIVFSQTLILVANSCMITYVCIAFSTIAVASAFLCVLLILCLRLRYFSVIYAQLLCLICNNFLLLI